MVRCGHGLECKLTRAQFRPKMQADHNIKCIPYIIIIIVYNIIHIQHNCTGWLTGLPVIIAFFAFSITDECDLKLSVAKSDEEVSLEE